MNISRMSNANCLIDYQQIETRIILNEQMKFINLF